MLTARSTSKARNICARFSRGAALAFTSSTSVYAQGDGEWVTEESPAEPDRETGRVLRATEEFVLAGGGIVARLAGIYGPNAPPCYGNSSTAPRCSIPMLIAL